MPYCPNCGSEINGEPKFCPQCGTPTTAAQTAIDMKSGARADEPSGDRTAKPVVAGIMAIIGGVAMIINDLIILAEVEIALGGTVGMILGWIGLGGALTAIRIFIAVAVILAILAIVGGVYALRRRGWGWALAGSICVLISPFFALGIICIILVVQAKSEFR